jgi:hypothetical protein
VEGRLVYFLFDDLSENDFELSTKKRGKTSVLTWDIVIITINLLNLYGATMHARADKRISVECQRLRQSR